MRLLGGDELGGGEWIATRVDRHLRHPKNSATQKMLNISPPAPPAPPKAENP